MDWNDAIERAKRVRAPELAVHVAGKSVGLLDGLLSKLRAQDEADRKQLRRMMVGFGVLGIVYVLIFTLTWIAPPDSSPDTARLALALFSILFITFGLWVRSKARDLAGIDYAKPLELFLREAESRYRFINGRDRWFLAAYYVTITGASGIGWMNAFSRYFPWLDTSTGLLTFVGFWLIVTTLGLVLGRHDWKKKREPLLHEIRSMRKELSADEGGQER